LRYLYQWLIQQPPLAGIHRALEDSPSHPLVNIPTCHKRVLLCAADSDAIVGAVSKAEAERELAAGLLAVMAVRNNLVVMARRVECRIANQARPGSYGIQREHLVGGLHYSHKPHWAKELAAMSA